MLKFWLLFFSPKLLYTLICKWCVYVPHMQLQMIVLSDSSSFNSLLVSYGYFNKIPQKQQLKTTEIYSAMILEARSTKLVSLGWNQDVSRAWLPLRGSKAETCLPLPYVFQLLMMTGKPQSGVASFSSLPLGSRCLLLFSLYLTPLCLPLIPVIAFTAHPDQPG